ncbi:hypothetical protein JKP88DRAFT_243944 [Tribonema minus]|uniref:Uncharacterized protein n=1 Tax=Tribonema minus TaxID=303371 RepID=A0A836CJ72_9STRA|nr:hypothetical protein JKP88DRAFT_243944 [Tribonema minus]
MPRKKARPAAPAPLVPHEVSEVMDWLGTDHLAPCFMVSHAWQGELVHRHPELKKLNKLNTYQRNTWHHLRGFRLTNVIAAVQRQCVLCHERWQGGINHAFGIPAHPKCVRAQLILSVPCDVPTAYAYQNLPYQSISGWTYNAGEFSCDGFWHVPHPAIPREWTIVGAMEDKADEICAFKAEEERRRAEAEQRRIEAAQVRAAEAKVRAQEREKKWRSDIAAEAEQQQTPFRSWSALQQALRNAPHVEGTVLRDSAQETVRRAALVLQEASHIPGDLLQQAFVGFDAQRVSLFRNYGHRVRRQLWSQAFAPAEFSSLETWSKVPKVVEDECAVLFVRAEERGINGAALCTRVQERNLTVFVPTMVDACRTATDISSFNEVFELLDILPRCSELAKRLVQHTRLKDAVRSYRSALGISSNAYNVWGFRCFTVPEGVDPAPFLHIKKKGNNERACHCGNTAALECNSNMCGRCCTGQGCPRHT